MSEFSVVDVAEGIALFLKKRRQPAKEKEQAS